MAKMRPEDGAGAGRAGHGRAGHLRHLNKNDNFMQGTNSKKG